MPFRLFNEAAEGLLFTDSEGFVTFANSHACVLLQSRPDAVIGRHVQTILGLGQAKCTSRATFDDDEVHGVRLQRAGDERIFHVRIVRLHADNGARLGCLLVLNAALPRSALRGERLAQRMLRQLAERDPGRSEPSDILRAAIDMFCGETGWVIGHAFVPSHDDPRRLVSAGIWWLPERAAFEEFVRVTRDLSFRAGEGLPGRVMEQQRPVWITDVNLDKAFVRAPVTGRQGLRAGFAFPVYAHRKLHAVLEFFDVRSIRPEQDFLATVEAIAGQLGLAIERLIERDNLDQLIHTDPLTGAANRRRFSQALTAALDFARNGVPCALALLDMDHFKSINDCYGHAEGDRVLVEVVRLLKRQIRTSDTVARLGGEEFAMLMLGVGLREFHALAERLRREISTQIRVDDTRQPVTTSLGIAMIDPRRDSSVEGVLVRADRALYRAKEAGRNRVEIAE